MRKLFKELGGGVSLYLGAPYEDTKGKTVIDLRFERKNHHGGLDILTTMLPSLPMEKNIGFTMKRRRISSATPIRICTASSGRASMGEPSNYASRQDFLPASFFVCLCAKRRAS